MNEIKIQQLIHLNSNAMKTISGSTYQTRLSSLGEIIIFCYWLQRSSVYSSMSGNTWCVTMQDKIFDAKCVVAQVQFFPMGAHWFIWCHIKSNNFKNCLLPKVSERATLQIPMTLESTVSPANFDQRFTDCLKGDISPLNDNLKR